MESSPLLQNGPAATHTFSNKLSAATAAAAAVSYNFLFSSVSPASLSKNIAKRLFLSFLLLRNLYILHNDPDVILF